MEIKQKTTIEEATLTYGRDNLEILDGRLGQTYKFHDTVDNAYHSYLLVEEDRLEWICSRAILGDDVLYVRVE